MRALGHVTAGTPTGSHVAGETLRHVAPESTKPTPTPIGLPSPANTARRKCHTNDTRKLLTPAKTCRILLGMTKTPETTNTTPAAWIGCLSCYNNGHLRGRWITAQQAADEQNETRVPTYGGTAGWYIDATGREYSRCVYCGGDEFDVFDTEHLPTKMTAAEFYKHAATLADLDDAGDLERITALAGWLSGDLDTLIAYDQDNYVGQYNTFQDYAEQYADDTALFADVPEHLTYYFDMAAFARDLEHDYYHDDTTGHTWHSV